MQAVDMLEDCEYVNFLLREEHGEGWEYEWRKRSSEGQKP
jgi:hypothetical protein